MPLLTKGHPEAEKDKSVEYEQPGQPQYPEQQSLQHQLPSTSTTVTSHDDLLPSFTKRTLFQFEAIFLTESQLSRFEDNFKEKNFSHPNPIYRSWLQLKFASLPTETEALESVLEKHSPVNIPRRKKAAKRTEPTGAARCDPTSPEWVDILTARDAAATLTSAKKQKLNNAEASTADNLPVLTCDLCGKKYGTKASLRTPKYIHKKRDEA